MPSYTESLVAPPARNPYSLDRGAGGFDGECRRRRRGRGGCLRCRNLGSTRRREGIPDVPAACVRPRRLKPSRGRVPSGTVSNRLAVSSYPGPLARTAADAALMQSIALVGAGHGSSLTRARPHRTRAVPGRCRAGRGPHSSWEFSPIPPVAGLTRARARNRMHGSPSTPGALSRFRRGLGTSIVNELTHRAGATTTRGTSHRVDGGMPRAFLRTRKDELAQLSPSPRGFVSQGPGPAARRALTRSARVAHRIRTSRHPTTLRPVDNGGHIPAAVAMDTPTRSAMVRRARDAEAQLRAAGSVHAVDSLRSTSPGLPALTVTDRGSRPNDSPTPGITDGRWAFSSIGRPGGEAAAATRSAAQWERANAGASITLGQW